MLRAPREVFPSTHSTFTFAGVSRELSLHPVHLTPDEKNNLPLLHLSPSAPTKGTEACLDRKELSLIT